MENEYQKNSGPKSAGVPIKGSKNGMGNHAGTKETNASVEATSDSGAVGT
jgi:hypothetical protein